MTCLEKRLTPRRAAWALAAVLLVGLVLRVLPILPYAMGPNTYSDDNGYLTSGVVFANTGYVAYADAGLQTTAIGPGMPLLLGGIIRLCSATPAGLRVAHVAFACIGMLTAIAAYLLAHLLAGSRLAGLAAAALCALEPALISTNVAFLTETPYMCLNLFAIYCFVSTARVWSLKRFWGGVMCMCGAALFKGLALLCVIAPLWVLIRRKAPVRAWLPKVGVAALAFALVMLPWWVRNHSVTGQFVPFTANRGDIQLMGTYEGFGYPEGTYADAVLQSDREAWEQGYQGDMERRFARRGEMGKERLAQWMREAPVGFVLTHVLYKPLKLTLQHMTTIPLLPDKLMALGWWACLALAAWGLICPRFGGRKTLGYYAPAVYLLVATYATAIYAPLPRYGVSHVPIWLCYTAAGALDLCGRLARLRSRDAQAAVR